MRNVERTDVPDFHAGAYSIVGIVGFCVDSWMAWLLGRWTPATARHTHVSTTCPLAGAATNSHRRSSRGALLKPPAKDNFDLCGMASRIPLFYMPVVYVERLEDVATRRQFCKSVWLHHYTLSLFLSQSSTEIWRELLL